MVAKPVVYMTVQEIIDTHQVCGFIRNVDECCYATNKPLTLFLLSKHQYVLKTSCNENMIDIRNS